MQYKIENRDFSIIATIGCNLTIDVFRGSIFSVSTSNSYVASKTSSELCCGLQEIQLIMLDIYGWDCFSFRYFFYLPYLHNRWDFVSRFRFFFSFLPNLHERWSLCQKLCRGRRGRPLKLQLLLRPKPRFFSYLPYILHTYSTDKILLANQVDFSSHRD